MGTTSKHKGGFYYLNCFYCFTTNKVESQTKVYEINDFCNIAMASEDIKIIQFNQFQIHDNATFTIYADLECLIEKIDEYKNNPENSSTTKVGEHITSSFSMYTIYN